MTPDSRGSNNGGRGIWNQDITETTSEDYIIIMACSGLQQLIWEMRINLDSPVTEIHPASCFKDFLGHLRRKSLPIGGFWEAVHSSHHTVITWNKSVSINSC